MRIPGVSSSRLAYRDAHRVVEQCRHAPTVCVPGRSLAPDAERDASDERLIASPPVQAERIAIGASVATHERATGMARRQVLERFPTRFGSEAIGLFIVRSHRDRVFEWGYASIVEEPR